MNDRELLEAAARAAGVPLKWPHDPDTYARVDCVPPRRTDTWDNWNPLTDDGDALRLAVLFKFTMDYFPDIREVLVRHPYVDEPLSSEFYSDDPYAATRRAIVRAAAMMAPASTEELSAVGALQ